jgi:hypothetical protein
VVLKNTVLVGRSDPLLFLKGIADSEEKFGRAVDHLIIRCSAGNGPYLLRAFPELIPETTDELNYVQVRVCN